MQLQKKLISIVTYILKYQIDKYRAHNRQSLLLNIHLASSSTDGQNNLLLFYLVGQIIIIRSKVVTHPANSLAFRRMRLGCQCSEVIPTNPRGAENVHHMGVQIQILYTIPTSDKHLLISSHMQQMRHTHAFVGGTKFAWQNCITCCIYILGLSSQHLWPVVELAGLNTQAHVFWPEASGGD